MGRKKTALKPPHPAPKTYKMECVSNPKQVYRIEKFLQTVGKASKLDDGTFYRLLVSCTEAVNNGIVHGNKSDSRKKVCVTCTVNTDSIVVRVKDEGRGFDPNAVPNPLDEKNLLKESGRGIFLIRSMVDKLDFEITGSGTTVVMVIDLRRLR